MKLLTSLAFVLICIAPLSAQIVHQNSPVSILSTEPTTARRNEFVIVAPAPILFVLDASPSEKPLNELRSDGSIEVISEQSNLPRAHNELSLTWHKPRLVIADAALSKGETAPDDPQELRPAKSDEGFQWRPALQQSLLFLAVQHGYALTQPKTRRDLKGEFFGDYMRSVKSLHGWEDGGRFFTNYIAHPMQGSFMGFIQIQNDPKGRKQRFGGAEQYWKSRMKALAWSAAWSTQFEIGPISQASIGNVGLHDKQTYVDIVMTPLGGTAMLITEDALDRFLIERIERNSNSFYLTIGSRVLLNPTRTIANLFRFRKPWFRDRPRAN